jgi:plastocyanin
MTIIRKGPKTVEILVEGGRMTYSPSFIRAFSGDQITWICNRGPFAIQFLGISPFPYTDYQGSPTQSVRDTIAVQQTGTYSYACAVYDPETQEVYMDATCPAIIIQR